MKKIGILILFVAFFTFLGSCHKKKYTEVVEVPLPSQEEKMSIGHPAEVKADEGSFSLYKLPFEYDALDEHFDAMTMELHYSKHYLSSTNNLNKLIKGTEKEGLSIEEILAKVDMNNIELRNYAGEFYNHTLFFENLNPKSEGKPKDTLAVKIDADFGSFENFKTQFEETANKQIGCGWTWLSINKTGKLQISSTSNQDNPLMPGQVIKGSPILALDLWEHAYYLKYQNNRKKYIKAFFNAINWNKVSEKYEEAINK